MVSSIRDRARPLTVRTSIASRRESFAFRRGTNEHTPIVRGCSSVGPWILLFIFLVSVTGCRGCQLPQASQDAKKKSDVSEKQPPARLELTALQSLPSASEGEGLVMKPGHWYEMQQSVRANESDEALSVSCVAIERAFPFRPIPPAGLRESITFERRISLARGQRKQLTLEMFFPRMPGGIELKKSSIRAAYRPRILGAAIREEAYPVTTMPDYQYYFVILSQNPARFQFLNGLSSVIWPTNSLETLDPINPFRVVQIAQNDVQYNLPNRLTTWTSTSHLLWNDCEASALLEKQQTSLVDWLHFGGQLIINGPESQGSFNNSFLSDYLPIKNLRAGKFNETRWQEFSSLWTIARYGEETGSEIHLPKDREPPSIDGELASGARWVSGCEGLVAERFVGGGRVVMTTFSLGESMLIRWPSFSSFFNGALMHRPSRVWFETNQLVGGMVFAGGQSGAERDPSYVSRVRLMGRDLGSSIPRWTNPKLDRTFRREAEVSNSSRDNAPTETTVSAVHNQGFAEIENDSVFGIGKIAMTALQKASGIQVPRVKTILQLLIGYLVVLVPLNWLVFRVIGRVEFAWLAAPCIAIVGAVVVARVVQLDIGFSRSQTTMNLFELRSGYPRGHLTSYISLYTSLSTQYRARYPSNAGILLPVSAAEQRNPAIQLDRNDLRYNYAEEAGAGLSVFPVRSNSTSFLKGEEIHEIGGSISIAWDESDPERIHYRNSSNLTLRSVGIIAKTVDGKLCTAWIGGLGKQADGRIRLSGSTNFVQSPKAPEAEPDFPFEEWKIALSHVNDQPSGAASSPKSEHALAVGTLLAKIAMRHVFGLREAILIGWTDDSVSPLEIEPKASQRTEASIVVVRLDAIEHSEIGPDLNLPPKLDEAGLPLPLDPDAPEAPEAPGFF